MSELYSDLLADVRYDGKYHSIKQLVQPYEPTVKAVADILVRAPDFISAAQPFVDSFTSYKRESGDYWRTPVETLVAHVGDCDDKAILLCSILRNYMRPDQVYCAFGTWKGIGHMWVVVPGVGQDLIIEATKPPDHSGEAGYELEGIFNDIYAFCEDKAIALFDLLPLVMKAAFSSSRRFL